MWLTVTDLKQWVYCPRIPYYAHVTPVEMRGTHSMERGHREQADLERLELRRTLGRYGLEEGGRQFGVWLESETMRLTGRLDMAIVTAEGVRLPVDFKTTEGGPAPGHRLQIAAYALMLEEQDGKAVTHGFLVTLPSGEVHGVEVADEMRERFRGTMAELRVALTEQRFPGRADRRGKCEHCEYRNFCGDVL